LVKSEFLHSEYASGFLTLQLQRLFEDLTVALYHYKYNEAFFSDVRPMRMDKEIEVSYVNNKAVMDAAFALQWIRPTRTRMAINLLRFVVVIVAKRG
jgi:hypothetical protein